MTKFVISKDGTKLAYSVIGNGLALVLVDGAFCHRKFGANENLPYFLLKGFKVFTYDRRGRNESENTSPYTVEKEVEDLQAIVEIAGGHVFAYGISSGAALVLEAARRGVKFRRILLFEAPFVTDNSRKPIPNEFQETLEQLISDKKMGEAVSYFLKEGVGLNNFIIWIMKLMPAWKAMKANSATLHYDAKIIEEEGSGKPLQADKWGHIEAPMLVVSGSKSEKWAQNSMKELANILPNANHKTLIGQNHIVKPDVIAQEIISYFNS